MSESSKILLTGGAGFIGSHLAERLERTGHEVTVLDDLSSGCEDNLRGCSRVRLVVGSVLDAGLVDDLVRAADRVVHLAATVGVERVATSPALAREVIEQGSRVVLETSADRRRSTILVSSSEVYGFEPRVPVQEQDALTEVWGDAPRLAYVRAKIAADRLARRLATGGSPVLVVRPFNVIGARQSASGGAVLPRFVQRALAGRALEVHGDGGQRRCFVDVRDVAVMLETLLWKLPAGPAHASSVVNVGGLEECSILELARRVVRQLDSSSEVRTGRAPAHRGGLEVSRRVPELRRLRRLMPLRFDWTIDDSIQAAARAVADVGHATGSVSENSG